MRPLKGVAAMAEFEDPDELLEAARALRREGYEELDAYTPFALETLNEEMGFERSRLPWVALAAGLLGTVFAYGLQWWISAAAYPLNVGGRPLHSGPAFIPITFETAVLFAAAALFVGFFWRCGLPELWHPVFEVDGFERASVDRYWLAVGGADPRHHPDATLETLRATSPLRVVLLGEDGVVTLDERLREAGS